MRTIGGSRQRFLLGMFVTLAAGGCAATQTQPYDVVLANGRVMDPESSLDAVRNVGIHDGKIADISTSALQAQTTIDVNGLIVTAGFIDLHSHGQDSENYRFKARDGVTTALEMEVGVNPVAAWYAAREGKALVNFGASSGHIPARMGVMHDTGRLLPRDEAANRVATPEEIKQVYERVREGLDHGHNTPRGFHMSLLGAFSSFVTAS